MLLLGIILFGLLVGAAAQLVLGTNRRGVDWSLALLAGLLGSFVGGTLLSLLFGDGFRLRASGLIGSLIGALIVTYLWTRLDRSRAQPSATARRR